MNVVIRPESSICNKRIISVNEEISPIFADHKVFTIKEIFIHFINCASCSIIVIKTFCCFSI